MPEKFDKFASKPEDFADAFKLREGDEPLPEPKIGDYVTIFMDDPKQHKYSSKYVDGVVVKVNGDDTVTVKNIETGREQVGKNCGIKTADLIPDKFRTEFHKIRRELGVLEN